MYLYFQALEKKSKNNQENMVCTAASVPRALRAVSWKIFVFSDSVERRKEKITISRKYGLSGC